jgi:hypothetical protein
MKPKPFSALNHLTVPEAMFYLLRGGARNSHCADSVAVMISPSENNHNCN